MARSISLGATRRGKDYQLPRSARETHMHVIGASGTGKTKFLESMIREDILNGNGLCLIDPHGNLYDSLIAWCAQYDLHRRRRIHLIDPTAEGWAIGFNPLHVGDANSPAILVDAVVNACAQVWGGEDHARTPLLKKCLRAVLYVLATRQLSLAEAMELTSAADPNFLRRFLTSELPDPIFRSVWADFNALPTHQFAEQFSSTNNRLIEFLASPVVRLILGQTERILKFRECMDGGEIVLAKLAPSGNALSADNARLIGTLMTNALFLAAFGRDERTAKQHPFFLYIDECYKYLTDDIERMLDETRKFGLHVVLAHQRIGQLQRGSEHIYNAVMNGAQTKVVFQTQHDNDAEILAQHIFRAEFDPDKPKVVLDKPVAIGSVPVWLLSESESEGETVTTSTTTVTSRGASASETNALSAEGEERGSSQTTSENSGYSEATSHAFSRSHSLTSGQHQSLKTVYETMHTATVSLEELLHRAIVKLRTLPKRSMIVKPPNAASAHVRTHTVAEPFASKRTVADFAVKVLSESPSARPARDAEREISGRLLTLIEQATAWRSRPPPPTPAEDTEQYLSG